MLCASCCARTRLRRWARPGLRRLRLPLDSEWIAEQQELSEEVREFLRVGGRFDFSGLLNVTRFIEKARIAGATLETTEIRDVLLVVDRAAEWREIALHPPASMRTGVETSQDPLGKCPRLHRVPAILPQQD